MKRKNIVWTDSAKWFAIALAALPSLLSATTVRTSYTAAGTVTWTCPVGVTEIQVECWGGGGASGGASKTGSGSSANNAAGGSGGGGAYATRINVPVTPGVHYSVIIPGAAIAPATFVHGQLSPDGADVTFIGDGGIICTAAGGKGGENVVSTGSGANGAGGAGGSPANSVGDILHDGGPGLSAAGGNARAGGGGAGDSGTGGSPAGGTGTLQAGGDGGDGRTGAGPGKPGSAPGGGAGGGKAPGSGQTGMYKGGNGALGRIVLTYGVPTYKADNTDDLNQPNSWTAGVPGSSDVANWDSTVTSANTVSLAVDTSWAGLSIQDPAGLVTINAGKTLTLTSSGIGTAIDMTSATVDLALDCDIALGAGNLWSVTSGRTLTVSGAISGSAGITKDGGGTLALNGTNTAYSGTTTLDGGTLSLGNVNALGSGSLVINAGVQLDSSVANLVNAGNNAQIWNSTVTFVGSENLDLGIGSVLMSYHRTVSVNNNATLTVGGTVRDNANIRNLTKAGNGTLVFGGVNTYGGATIINNGVLSVSSLANGGANSGIGNSGNVAANLVLNGGTLQYTGTGASCNRLFTLGTAGGALDASGSGALSLSNGGSIAFSGSGARTLTLTGGNTVANTLAADIGDSGGATSLTKSGPGTWVITGASTFTGVTRIEAGRLQLGANDALGASSGVHMAGGTLDMGSYSIAVGALEVTGAATILLGPGSLHFLDSSGVAWPGTLTLTGTLGPTTLRFGTNGEALTSSQLQRINIDGDAVEIDDEGYLVNASQPSRQGTVLSVR